MRTCFRTVDLQLRYRGVFESHSCRVDRVLTFLSRFFLRFQGDSDSEEEDPQEEEESDEDDEAPQAAQAVNKYMGADSDSDDEGDQQRRVVSAKDKRYAEMTTTIEQMKNQMKINDWVSLQVCDLPEMATKYCLHCRTAVLGSS